MKREITREGRLPAFAWEIADLDLLWSKLNELFDKDAATHSSVVFRLPNEKLSFESMEELREATLNSNIKRFSISFFQSDRSVYISAGSMLNYFASVSATSSSEAWCAGAVETVTSAAKANKRWYHWLMSLPLGLILLVISNLPTLLIAIRGNDTALTSSPLRLVAWYVAIAALLAIWFFRPVLLPASTIITANSESFIKKHAGELSLFVAVISAVLTLIGLFAGK
jgi:hypothetical protein